MEASAHSRESGQAAVESAMVMPLMVFLCLGIIQLTMIEHARIMTDYAAYNAVRAGIVWNGNNERMHDAAIFSLLPTMARTDDLAELAKTWAIAEAWDTALAQIMIGKTNGAIPDTFRGNNLGGLVRIDTINPSYWSAIDSIWNLPDGVNWKEMDFDGADTYPEATDLEKNFAKFFNLDIPENQEETYRKANVLSIRLRYWYSMRVPFANWIIFTSWFAANAGVELYGAIDRATTTKSSMMNQSGNLGLLGAKGKGITWNQKGFKSVYWTEMVVLWMLSKGVPILGRRYYLPLTSTYSMRMQSNFYRKWIMHLNPSWGL